MSVGAAVARRPGLWVVALLGTGLAASGACAGKYLYGPLGAVVAQPRPKGCEFALVYAPPEQAHDALGVLAPQKIDSPAPAQGEGPFRSAVAAQVCAAGGDAVVVERDGEGQYVRGTIIKLR